MFFQLYQKNEEKYQQIKIRLWKCNYKINLSIIFAKKNYKK